MCSVSLSPKRNSSVIGLNLSPNAPAYSSVYPSLPSANETGNRNQHPYMQGQRSVHQNPQAPVQFYHMKPTDLKSFQASTKGDGKRI